VFDNWFCEYSITFIVFLVIMPNYCAIRESHCVSKTLFGVPKEDEIKNLWENALGIKLKKSFRVCASHFKECDIISTWESGEGLNKYTVSILLY